VIEKCFCIAVSPYLFKERLNLDAKGDNKGGTGDEGNAAVSLYALRTARLLVGIDDSNPAQLRLVPRLPRSWQSLSAKNWLVSHDFAEAKTDRVAFTYERQRTNGYTLSFTSSQSVRKLQVRLGPFQNSVQNVQLMVNGKTSMARPTRIGMPKWVLLDLDDVTTLNVAAEPTGG
jgi:hypothetical protein